jgi:hypothetical protein
MKTTTAEELAALVGTRILNRDGSGMALERLTQKNIELVYQWWGHQWGGARGKRFITETATFATYLKRVNGNSGLMSLYSSSEVTKALIGIGMLAGALALQEENDDFEQGTSPSNLVHSLQLIDVGSPEDPFPAATDIITAQACTLKLTQLQPRFALICASIEDLSEAANWKSGSPPDSPLNNNGCPFIPFLIGAAAMGIYFNEVWDYMVEEI